MIITKQQFIPATILAILVPVLILLYDYYSSTELSAYAEIAPLSEWVMVRGNNDQITSSLMNNQTGVMSELKVLQFDRGETMSLNFLRSFEISKRISSGDTIAQLTSSELNQKITEIENELSIAKATLVAGLTGEKDAIIKELVQSKEANKDKLALQKKALDRKTALFSKNLISETEYESAQQDYKQLEFDSLILDAKIESVTSGEKPAVISLLKTKLQSYERSLDNLKSRRSGMILTSPISGTIIPCFNSDTLLSIVDLSHVILKVPLRLNDAVSFNEGDSVSVTFTETKLIVSGVVARLSQKVKLFNTEPVRVITVEINNSGLNLLPGMVEQVKLLSHNSQHAN